MEPVPKSLGRTDSQRVKEVRFASATIVFGSVIIVLNILCLLLAWVVVDFGATASTSATLAANQSVSNEIDPFGYNSSQVKLQLSFGVTGIMSGSVTSPSGSHSFAADFKSGQQQSGSVSLKSNFLKMCSLSEIPSTDILHTNTFAVWLHYATCHVQPTILMPLLCLSVSFTFLSILLWTVATWPIPFLDNLLPMWRERFGLVLGRAASLYKCAFVSTSALGLSVAADVIFWMLVTDKYSAFLKKYADEQAKINSQFVHSFVHSIGYFIALITSGSLLDHMSLHASATPSHPNSSFFSVC
jgi:hypothetical protein